MNALITTNDPGAHFDDRLRNFPFDSAVLQAWADKGWLRRLDSAMATFMLELDASASPVLLVCTAVLAQMEGRGHTCLPLRLLVTSPDDVLAWPPLAQAEVQALWSGLPKGLDDWLVALRSSPLVRSFDDPLTSDSPWF
jgi:exodeoxyribonuclease V alpha subunit